MPEQDHLESFIGNSFRSVWALEVLQFLVEHIEASFSPEELISALRRFGPRSDAGRSGPIKLWQPMQVPTAGRPGSIDLFAAL